MVKYEFFQACDNNRLGVCQNPGSQWVNDLFIFMKGTRFLPSLTPLFRQGRRHVHSYIYRVLFNGRFKSKYINILYISISKITGALSHRTKMETAGPPEDQRWTGGLKTTFLFVVSGNVFFWIFRDPLFFAQLWQSLG